VNLEIHHKIQREDIEAAFSFLEENAMPMFDSREVRKLRDASGLVSL
jgi:hypothetical protein